MEDLKIKTERDIKEGEIVVGIAETPEQKIGRLEVVTERYKNEGYLEDIAIAYTELPTEDVVGENGFTILEENLSEELFEEFIKHGLLVYTKEGKQLFLDKYHWQSIQFVAQTDEGYVGSARIILYDKNSEKLQFPLPILSDEDISIYDEWKEIVLNMSAEFSQFAKSKKSSPKVAAALLRAAAVFSKQNGIKEWAAVTDRRVVEALNGAYYNFNLPKIGPSVKYLGSISTPIHIDIDKALDNAESYDSSRYTAKFIRGEDIPGFEWYTGA